MDLAAERWRARRRKGLKITPRVLAQTSDRIVLPKQSAGVSGSAEILKCLLQLVAVYLNYFFPSWSRHQRGKRQINNSHDGSPQSFLPWVIRRDEVDTSPPGSPIVTCSQDPCDRSLGLHRAGAGPCRDEKP